jgi:trehalose 6-phosphate synthase
LAPLLDEGRATWVAVALSDAERRAARGEPVAPAGDAVGDPTAGVHLVAPDPEDQRLHYDVVSNETLWFVHHGLFDLTREPAYDEAWWAAWEAYRRVNRAVALAVCEHAPADAAVLVQDYHLTLVAPLVRADRPDLRLVHFHHTPFAGPEGARALPPEALHEMVAGLAAHHACGFHTPAWQANFDDVRRRCGRDLPDVSTFHSTLGTDVRALAATAASPACEEAATRLDDLVGDRQLIVRVDRMELSKNIVRGFRAFDLLLERRADLRGRVVFLACCYPSRENVPAYARYRAEVEAAAAAVNERWGDARWRPVELLTDDDYPRSVAALRRYDVLLVNPVRDGLNLVAKEGPAVNERDGQLVLSTEAGAWSELVGAADGVSPFDLRGTADALAAALDRPSEERRARAAMLERSATARTPSDWLEDQLGAAGTR